MRIEDFEARLQPYKLALLEAFDLDPGKTSSNVSANAEVVTFKCIGLTSEELADMTRADVWWDINVPGLNEVTFPARGWNDEQRQAVESYRGQFPSIEDLPREVRAALRNSLEQR